MKIALAVIGSILGLLILTMGIGWVSAGNEFAMFRYFAPRREAVRREVFEQSKAYRQGMINELRGYQVEYIKGDPAQKAAMATLILRQADQIPAEDLPADLAQFITTLRPGSAQ
jgi:hypothetical protein